MKPMEMRTIPPGYITSRFGILEYTNWIDESMAWKQTCTLGDWSWIWERRFKGRDALKLLSDTTVNGFENFAILQSKHAIHCNENSKVIAEGIHTRLGEDEFVLMGRGSFWVDYVRGQGQYDVDSEAIDWYNLQVAGPKAIPLLEAVSGTDLRGIKFMHSGEIEIAGNKLLALRQGMSGEPGFELQGPRDHANAVIEELLRVGKEFGLRQLGGRASNTGHLESCFPTIFQDYLPAMFDDKMEKYRTSSLGSVQGFASSFSFDGSYVGETVEDYYRSPIELGWNKNVKFDHDFIGRSALEQEVAAPRRLMRTLVWNAEDVIDVYASMYRKDEPFQFMEMPRHQRATLAADRVVSNGRDIGVATSRGYSYFFREMLSLAVIEPEFAEIGTDVTVIWGNPGQPEKAIRAQVAAAPYRDNRRADLRNY